MYCVLKLLAVGGEPYEFSNCSRRAWNSLAFNLPQGKVRSIPLSASLWTLDLSLSALEDILLDSVVVRSVGGILLLDVGWVGC